MLMSEGGTQSGQLYVSVDSLPRIDLGTYR